MLKKFVLSGVLMAISAGTALTPVAMAADRDDHRHNNGYSNSDHRRNDRDEREYRKRIEREQRERLRRERERENFLRNSRGRGYYDRFGYWHPYGRY